MRRYILGVSAAAMLNGCATTPIQQRWRLDEGAGATARLELGTPDGEARWLTMTCRPHSDVVDVTVAGQRGDGAVVELHSGKIWNRYAGAGHLQDEGLWIIDIDLKLAAFDPVLRQFADKGDLTIVFTSTREILPNGFAQAHDFINICRAPN